MIRTVRFVALFYCLGFAFAVENAHAQSAGPTQGIIAPVATPASDRPDWLEAYAGLLKTKSFQGGYVGAVVAQNMTNLWVDGVLFRVEFAGGEYDPTVDTFSGSALVGYRKDIGFGYITGYLGVAIESHSNAGPTALITGTEGGVKTALEYNGKRVGNFELYAAASYSTNFDTTFAFARPGMWILPTLMVGPEFQYFANEAYRDYKIGGFVQMDVAALGRLTLSGGYLEPLTAGSVDGYYANLSLLIRR